MSDSEGLTEPVNPLVEPLTAIAVGKVGTQRTVQGRMVAPGLAITPDKPRERGGLRYALTHVPSGLAARLDLCGVHVQDMVKLAVDSGIDWTLGLDEVTAAIKAVDLGTQLRKAGYCRDDWCAGDGTPPPSWEVSCSTCYWSSADEPDTGPFDAKDAKYEAREHRCEPEVTIRDPATKKWHDPYFVNDDGTVRDMTVTSPSGGRA